MLKKVASAIALLGAGGLAHAQSSVQIYGIMDTAVETMNNVGATKSSLTRMPNLTGSVPSRLGFRG
ncbi:porin, partial [Comamonas thiooxydans]|uniref:porin n=1 Tax=Comamonas thiooxydans TaxID=363952 RepID=UPI00057A7592